MSNKEKINKLGIALKKNIQKRKLFQKKSKKKSKQMPVLSDKWIRKMASEKEMISPFEDKQIRGNKISFGGTILGLVQVSIIEGD